MRHGLAEPAPGTGDDDVATVRLMSEPVVLEAQSRVIPAMGECGG